jgi:hypothetical protein
MSYFNELVGGSLAGSDHLIDSNIDWGQDLLYLKSWLNDHPEAKPFGFAYYHILDPQKFGVDFSLPPPGPNGLFPDEISYQKTMGPRPGYYAVSVNHLRGARFAVPDGKGGLFLSSPGRYEYFRRFRPIARAGFSIFIDHLRIDEVNQARHEMGLPLLD